MKKTMPYIISILLITVVLIFGFIFIKSQNVKSTSNGITLRVDKNAKEVEGSDTYQKEKTSQPMFTVTGYTDMKLKKGSEIFLINDKENEKFNIYVSYSLYRENENTPFYNSDLIEAGKQVSFIPSDYLEPGENIITITQTAYLYNETLSEYVTKNGGTQSIKINID